jgi:hypothetical protein
MFIASWAPNWPPSSGYYWGIYSGIPPASPGTTGSVSFSLTAPSTPGVYYLWFVFDANLGYSQAASTFNTPLVTPAHIEILVGFGSVVSSVVQADADSTLFVLPDFNAGETGSMHTGAAKCGGRVTALATDVYAATYLFGSLWAPPQNEVEDTNSAYISQSSGSCGQPTTPASEPVVAVAGPPVSEVVNYYESSGQTPLFFGYNGQAQECITRRDTGATVVCTLPTATNDYFLMEAFTDSAGRMVLIIYGLQWGGTLAGFQYLVNYVWWNPSAYNSNWYVFRWQDATSGASANGIPDPDDTYTLIANGP